MSLVGATGGAPTDQRDHRGTLSGMGIDADLWGNTIGRTIEWLGTAIGHTHELLKEARRREARRIVSSLKIYID